MGLETVKGEVISNARNQEKALLAEASKEASEITKKAEGKLRQIKEQGDETTKMMIDTIKHQEMASAELENKKILLETKKQLIENVFLEVGKKLETLDSGKRQEYVKKLLENAKNDIEVANVYCNEKDVKFVGDLKSESADILGGVIAENDDGTVRVDYSFDTLLENIKENELQNINKVLFGDDGKS
jgi:V/A-type H+/Na+-transporting ATPase subunit E